MKYEQFTNQIISVFFPGHSQSELYNYCPNHMLWEAIRAESASVINRHNIPVYLQQCKEFYMFTELLQPDGNGYLLHCTPYNSSTTNQSLIKHIVLENKVEPLYIVSNNFTWMIVLTTENTPSGDQLCVLVNAHHSR